MVRNLGPLFLTLLSLVLYCIRACVGEPHETSEILKTFGIPAQFFPLTNDGKLFLGPHQKRLKERKALEKSWRHIDASRGVVVSDESDASVESSRPTTPIQDWSNQNVDSGSGGITPRPQDCLFGKRGNAIWKEQAGNRLYTQFIELHFEAYDCAPKYRKQEIADVVIQAVYDAGGCFLNFDSSSGTWSVVDDQTILREKAGNYFRNRRRDLNRKQKQVR